MIEKSLYFNDRLNTQIHYATLRNATHVWTEVHSSAKPEDSSVYNRWFLFDVIRKEEFLCSYAVLFFD